jgi:precorrin-3B C17-methyltransferase
MAGIVLELADPEIEIEVVPGITAATAAAASLGAPLMHDFALISLSDLLTPYDKIMDRIKHCSMADMAIVIYNPRSHGRQKHLDEAREIMLQYKSPETPVGLVRNAKRGEEEVVITTLGNLPNEEIDMLTVVLVGNSETRVQNGKMITPRGYHKKEEYHA